MRSLSRDEVRAIDRRAIDEYGLAGVVLMENAGAGVARLVAALGIDGPVAIACGPGNNGGDGFVIARHLELTGHEVRILLAAPRAGFRGDAAVNLTVAERSGLAISDLAAADAAGWRDALFGAAWIIDALLGTGATGAPRGTIAAAIEAINDARAAGHMRVLAVDLPSGLDADTGATAGACVTADVTATFVAPKRGFDAPDSCDRTGPVHVIGIGAPACLLAAYGVSGRAPG
jgi:NAD(P)H-hydrate epimerase